MMRRSSKYLFLSAVLLLIIGTASLFLPLIQYDARTRYRNEITMIDYASLAYDTSNYVYLSDIPYETEQTYVKPGHYVRLDKNSNSNLITVPVGGEKQTFIKGISAWATSNIEYDVSNYDYDYFTGYLGVDASQTTRDYNSGVTITVSTSVDGIKWKEELKTPTLKGWNDAVFAKVDIRGVKYLRLYAYEIVGTVIGMMMSFMRMPN